MKYLFALVCVLFLFQESNAQVKNENITFGVNTGISMPLNDFQSAEPTGDRNGYAENGFFMNFTGNYKLNSSWSLVGMLYYNQNPANPDDMQANYYNQTVDYIERLLDNNDQFEVNVPDYEDDANVFFDADEWMATSALFGGKYTVPLKRWTLEGQVLAGIQYTRLPIHTLRIREASKAVLYTHQSTKDSDFSLAAMLSASLRMPLTARTQLRFSVDYYYSRVDLEQELAEFSNGSVNDRTDNAAEGISVKINYATFNAGVGIIYNF